MALFVNIDWVISPGPPEYGPGIRKEFGIKRVEMEWIIVHYSAANKCSPGRTMRYSLEARSG